MAHAFFLGVDAIDGEDDRAAECTLALVEKTDEDGDDMLYRVHRISQQSEPDAAAIADKVQELATDSPFIGRTMFVVNQRTSLGNTIFAELQDRGLAPVGALITGGMGAVAGTTDEVAVDVAEHDAVRRLASFYRDQKLQLDHLESEEASNLAHGLHSYDFSTPDESGQEMPEEPSEEPARVEQHDTVVLSAALACWIGSERTFDPTSHLKEDVQTTGRADVDAGADITPGPPSEA